MNVAQASDTAKRLPRAGLRTLAVLLGHRLHSQARAMFVWGLVLGAINALTVAFFPTFEQSGASDFDLGAYLQNLSPEMVAIFGLQGDLTSIQGFLAANSFNFFVPLAMAFYPMLLGAATIAGAEEQRRLDTLLSNPLPRWQLVLAGFVTLALSFLGALAVMGVLTWLPAVPLDVELPLADVMAAALNVWPLGLFTGALALLVSSLVRRSVMAVAIPGGLLVIMYFVDALGKLSNALEPLAPLTIFHYYGSAIEHGIDWPSFTGICVVAVILTSLAGVAFQRRDLYT